MLADFVMKNHTDHGSVSVTADGDLIPVSECIHNLLFKTKTQWRDGCTYHGDNAYKTIKGLEASPASVTHTILGSLNRPSKNNICSSIAVALRLLALTPYSVRVKHQLEEPYMV